MLSCCYKRASKCVLKNPQSISNNIDIFLAFFLWKALHTGKRRRGNRPEKDRPLPPMLARVNGNLEVSFEPWNAAILSFTVDLVNTNWPSNRSNSFPVCFNLKLFSWIWSNWKVILNTKRVWFLSITYCFKLRNTFDDFGNNSTAKVRVLICKWSQK